MAIEKSDIANLGYCEKCFGVTWLLRNVVLGNLIIEKGAVG